MEAYPDEYVSHNLPLILLSGLEPEASTDSIASERARTFLGEGGFRIRAELPPIQSQVAEELLKLLLSRDSTKAPWHSQASEKGANIQSLKIRSVGRSYTLPPRKASPPAHAPRLTPANDNISSPPPLVLHSTLSPLTPSSPLYPDGLFTPLWITKHQNRLPSTFVSFYSLISDGKQSSLQDNKIKSEVHNIRSTIVSTNNKTRFVVVLVGDGPISQTDIEERLINIRRAANLDAKSLFFLPHGVSSAEVADFATSLLSNIYPTCLEYYRDLSKHARRKRNRNVAPQPTVPPTEGTSSILSLASWNVRYELKLGVFAEFRQEMEAACRNYETAYEGLFGPEVFESVPSWSPRFDEVRLLVDVIAIRIIRCLLWSSQGTQAVKWHVNHRNRIHDFINRRGKGTENDAWEAWQNIWSKTMAELITRSQVSPAKNDTTLLGDLTGAYMSPEKALSEAERMPPWGHLHHQGYWLNLAQRFTQNQRARAGDLLEHEPDSTNRNTGPGNQDRETYLMSNPSTEKVSVERPGYPYSEEIIKNLEEALEHFQVRSQTRMIQVLKLKQATEYLRTSLWEKAVAILRPLWSQTVWSKEGWWILFAQVGMALLKCAHELDDQTLIAEVAWQSSNPVLENTSSITSAAQTEPDPDAQDIENTTDSLNNLTKVLASFAFASAQGHVGEQLSAQLSLSLLNSPSLAGMQVLEVIVAFEGGIKPIIVEAADTENDDKPADGSSIHDLLLTESLPTSNPAKKRSSLHLLSHWTGHANLKMSIGTTKIWNLTLVPREAGSVSVSSVTISLVKENLKNTVTLTELSENPPYWWETRRGKPLPRDMGFRRDVTSITILPKPPKVEFEVSNLSKAYYTNEDVSIELKIINKEEASIHGGLEMRLISPRKNGIRIECSDGESPAESSEGSAGESIQTLPKMEVSKLGPGASTKRTLLLTKSFDAVDHELEAVLSYTLLTDPGTPLTKSFVLDLPIVRPFEANIHFHSRRHNESWPSFFSPPLEEPSQPVASGLKHSYLAAATVASFAHEQLEVKSVKLVAIKIVGGAVCQASSGRNRTMESMNESDEVAEEAIIINPEETKHFVFDMTLQKLLLGDRLPVTVDFSLEIAWTREGSSQQNLSTLILPKFLAAMSEPRVLLQVLKSGSPEGVYQLIYTIENPSMHFLTFNVTMESGENFAFSGTKSRTLSLVPVSRSELTFHILSYVRSDWIKVHLEVVAAYFGQTLKIQPACDGVKIDKQGQLLVWVD